MKNFGNTVSNTVLASMSTEVGNAVDVVRKQAQALMESVNQLIAVVNEPEIQQALIEVRDGLQKVLDKFDNTGMRDIDSLIEVVSELRDVTDKLTDALQKLQERVNTETGTEGSSAADLADELQLQQSLQVIYSTLEDTIKAMDNVPQLMSTFSGALGSFTQQQLNAYMQFTEAREQLNEYEKQLETAKQEYETAKNNALAQADVTKQLDIETLAQLIYAQNFSMPAGYVQDQDGESWLLKVGEEYNSVDDIAGALLLHVDGYGAVRLSDVADVEVIDNAADSFTRLNGEQAAVLKIYKNATSSASDVSDNCLSAFQELEAQYDGLHIVVLSNQGNYITIIIRSILTSMAVGAALAIIVLAIFLKDVKPTLVVGISIPLSVLFAVVLMYFTNLDMNVMTLAGLSLGIGMLVAGGNWIKFGVVLIVFGAFLAWWSKNLHHTLARDFIDSVEADESMGGRYRRVAANEDGLMVWGKSGKSQFFPFEKLDHVLDGERIFVAMFADQGVTIPKETFIRGDAEQFGTFLKARINKKLRIETKRKKMKAEKAAAEAKQGDKPQETKGKQRKQKKNKKKR